MGGKSIVRFSSAIIIIALMCQIFFSPCASAQDASIIGWVDDVSLSNGLIVQNSGFEDGSGNNQPHWNLCVWWGNGEATTDTTVSHSGSKSIRLTNYDNDTTAFATQGGPGCSALDRIAVEPDTTYTIFAWIKSEIGHIGKFTFKVAYYDSSDNRIDYSYQIFDGGINWQKIALTFTTSSNAETIDISIDQWGTVPAATEIEVSSFGFTGMILPAFVSLLFISISTIKKKVNK